MPLEIWYLLQWYFILVAQARVRLLMTIGIRDLQGEKENLWSCMAAMMDHQSSASKNLVQRY